MNVKQNARLIGLRDQHGKCLIAVETKQGTAYLHMGDVAEPAKAVPKLAMIGLPLPPGKHRSSFFTALSEVEQFEPVHIVDQIGWQPNGFVLGDGSQILPEGAERLRTLLDPEPDKWTVSGTLKGWKTGVARPLTGQPIPMLTLMLAFAPPLMRFVDCWTNPGFELVGAGGKGKSTLLMTAASVYGGIGSSSGGRYFETWNLTAAGMETLLDRHTNCLLILDELNSLTAGGTTSAKRQAYNGIVFNLASGIDKTRYQEKRNRQRSFCYLSSSNTPLVQELTGGAPDVVSAAADRLLTISADAGSGLGVFHFVPDGFSSSKALIDSIRDAAGKNHGVAIRVFLQRLVQDVADDEDGLAERLRNWVREFGHRAQTGADAGRHNRTAEPFALVYAAGRLAQFYGVLPKRWKCGPAVMACYKRHAAEKAIALGGAEERIKAYAASKDVLRCEAATDVSYEEFRRSAGLLVDQGGGQNLIVHTKALRERVSDALALVKALEVVGMVERDDGTYQTKRMIGSKSRRVYVFKLGA